MTELSIELFANGHLDGLAALVLAEGWSEYAVDVGGTSRALSARGVKAFVAIEDGPGAGALQVQSDGVIEPHVSMLFVDQNRRGRLLGFRLVREGLERAGGLRLDIRTRTKAYHERFGASRSLGSGFMLEHLGLRAIDSRAAR